ncbi:MAG: hypothetical protein IIU58_06760 [Clostridia bacterium]|nr:hypothetical protein [Clostridia bacterium]
MSYPRRPCVTAHPHYITTAAIAAPLPLVAATTPAPTLPEPHHSPQPYRTLAVL